MIDTPGIYELSAEEYHEDPCVVPSLSASVGVELLNSPAHARVAHPRLNSSFKRERSETFDLGTAAHSWLLEGNDAFEVIEAPDWRKAEARSARDAAYGAGKLPILAGKLAEVKAMAEAIHRQLDEFKEGVRPFVGGAPERSAFWQEGDVWCRARLDYVNEDAGCIFDLKTTGASANPETWCRGPLWAGCDLQAAFHVRAMKILTDREFLFRFVVVENFPPYALSVVSLGPAAAVIAEKKRIYAVEKWRECVKQNVWPSYPRRICHAELPPWIESAWIAREEREL